MGSCGSPLVFFGGFNPPKDDPGIQSKLKGFQVYFLVYKSMNNPRFYVPVGGFESKTLKILHLAEMYGKCREL